MMTNPTTTVESIRALLPTSTQKVVMVNGDAEILDLLETVLDSGHYDVVFVESSQHAYSQIKRVQPNLVILCMRMDGEDGFQVLSMLKLDSDTRDIPVLTYTIPLRPAEDARETAEPTESEIFPAAKSAVLMH
jgi:CheY-like chemotaxis protein